MYTKVYTSWLENAVLDNDLKEELLSVKDNADAISDRFYTDLDFGTAGLRGIIGAGTNRMNVYTVGRATQALAEYVNLVSDKPSVAIAYDSRIKSTLFAETAAGILASNGVHVYIYKELMPTPMLSFAVRKLGCDAGIVITASHNRAIYNGYKVYGSDGCQLSPVAAENIMQLIKKTDYFGGIKFADFNEELSGGNIEYIGDDVIESYLCEVEKQSVMGDILDLSNLKVVYTPLHGTGNKPVRNILKRIGITDVSVVKEQELPDGNFPTAPYPNPELRQPFELALALADKNGADLLLGTDPDADRVGIAVKNGNDYTLLTGNEVGALLLNYILEARKEKGTLPDNPIAVKTVVTTELCQKIADDNGCELINVLTGFKFIGEQIGLLESKGEENRYILGFEESYGYLAGSYVRDKDAVVASMLICEMAAYYKKKGLTLIEKLEELFNKYGYFINAQQSFAFEGENGIKQMNLIMNSLRTNPPKSISNLAVTTIKDYRESVVKDSSGSIIKTIDLPKSNVIEFVLEDGSKIIYRPSGTEPKIKIYLCALDSSRDKANAKIEQFKIDTKNMMN